MHRWNGEQIRRFLFCGQLRTTWLVLSNLILLLLPLGPSSAEEVSSAEPTWWRDCRVAARTEGKLVGAGSARAQTSEAAVEAARTRAERDLYRWLSRKVIDVTNAYLQKYERDGYTTRDVDSFATTVIELSVGQSSAVVNKTKTLFRPNGEFQAYVLVELGGDAFSREVALSIADRFSGSDLQATGRTRELRAMLILSLGIDRNVATSNPSAPPLKIPLSFDPYIECLGPRSLVTRQDWWVVYADRDNVPVYVDRHGTEVNSNLELSLGEELWVLDEEQSSRMLLLGESHSIPRDKEDPEITNTVGWVKWDHLILSREPMKNRETLVSKKFFVVNDWRRFKKADDIQDFRDAKVSVRAAPSADAVELGKITGIGDRLSYIYKQESCDVNAQWYLVGRRNKIIPGSVDENIGGWIPASRAQPWDNRQALEPQRNRKGPAHVYILEADLTDPTVEPMFKDLMSREPWPADKWRYVVLDAEQGREGIQIGWHIDVAFRSNPVQIFEKGWVRLRDDEGNNTMTPVQLVSLTELDQTERALLKLFPSGRDADPADLLQSWRDIVGVILGDEPANVREYVDMVGGILFRENSPILALNFDEILDMSDEEFQAVLKYAKEALDRVGELRTNQEIWFENYSDRYAWIPNSQLP